MSNHRTRGRRRGSFGQWSTDDQQGAVRDHAGWDATRLAVVDGGGCVLYAGHDPVTDDDQGMPTRRPTRRGKGGRR